jgi:hypothetical protein
MINSNFFTLQIYSRKKLQFTAEVSNFHQVDAIYQSLIANRFIQIKRPKPVEYIGGDAELRIYAKSVSSAFEHCISVIPINYVTDNRIKDIQRTIMELR